MPYFDFTISAAKSVSVLHASLRVSAVQARKRGDDEAAADLDSRAQAIEDALMETAREVVAWLERHAAYTRTGHHSATTGEWRDADGLAAALFLHTSPVTVTRSCMCTSRCGTGSSVPTAPTPSGGHWTPARCTTSGSAPPPSPTRHWKQSCPRWGM